MRIVFIVALLGLFHSAPAFAQYGIAVRIDSNAFYDPKNGIPELVAIEAQLEREFAPLVVEAEKFEKQIAKLENDLRIAKDANNIERIERLSDEIEKQSRTLRQKAEGAQMNLDRRRKQISEPIEASIVTAIEAYAAEKKYDVVLDASSNPLYASESWVTSHDRTADFTKWYRARKRG